MTGEPLHVTDRVVIPAADLSYEYARSGGPGGQHVNTADTAVRVRLALDATTALRPEVKERLRAAHPGAITQSGELIVTSERHRSRLANLEDARAKLAAMIRAQLRPPRPRVPTKPTRASQARRRQEKARRSSVKQGRGRVRDD